MHALTRRIKVSPATLIAIIALCLAVGGAGAYAAQKTINGKSIKKRSIKGNKLAKNTLTGAEINESKLATVPSASQASVAGDAQTLGGQPPGAFTPSSRVQLSGLSRIPTDGLRHDVLTRAPVTFWATCTSSAGNSKMHVYITPTEPVFFVNGTTEVQPPLTTSGATREINNLEGTGTFNTVTTFSVVGADGTMFEGTYTMGLNAFGVPCGVSVTTIG